MNKHTHNQKRTRANARLIAAAPDLLAACKISGVSSVYSHGLLHNVAGILRSIARSAEQGVPLEFDGGQIETLRDYAATMQRKADAEFAAIAKAEVGAA